MLLNSDIAISITHNNFIRNKKSCVIHNLIEKKITSSYIHLNKENCILAALSEYLEREVLILKNHYIYGKEVEAYSLVDNKKTIIDRETILEKRLFVDSCGMAAHKNSNFIIENALDEFIERQSFIFNYLSKTPGENISFDFIKKIINIDNYFSSISFYNISLIKGYFVIFAKGLINNQFHVGLGSSNDFTVALNKCIKELYQCKNSYTYPIDKVDIINEKEFNYDVFFYSLDPLKVKKAYEYLEKGNLEFDYDIIYSNKLSLFDAVKKLNYVCKINPHIVVYNTKYLNSNIKVIQIIDLNWFPALLPYRYNTEVYDYVEKVMDRQLDRKCNFIPFP